MFQRTINNGWNRDYKRLDTQPLTKFNMALITDFVPEALNVGFEDYEGFYQGLFSLLQKEDMYNALTYAENEILPNLNPDKLKSNEQLSEYIKNVHRLVATGLALDYGTKPGEFIDEVVIRWKKTTAFEKDFVISLKNNLDLKLIFDHYELSDVCQPFSAILDKIKKDKSIVLSDETLSSFDRYDSKPKATQILLHKLVIGYQQNFFNSQEKNVIEKVMKIGQPVKNIPQEFKQFTEQLFDRILKCNGTQSEVIKLAAFAFERITEIHAFFNANGRTATIFLNLILIHFGFPSILLRNEEESENPNSTYNLAIQNIETDITLLEKHILKKLNEAQKLANDGFNNRNVLDKLKLFSDISAIFYDVLKMGQTTKNFNYIKAYENALQNSKFRKGNKPLNTNNFYQSNVTFNYATDPTTAYINFVKFLEEVTQAQGWKFNKEKGKVWLPCDTKENASSIIQNCSLILKDLDITISLQSNSKTKQPLVWFDNVSLTNINKLLTLKNNNLLAYKAD